MYYNIGLKLIQYNKWGSSFIDTLAKDLKIEFPTIKGMSARNLRYVQKFANEFDNDEFLQGVLAKLSWGFYYKKIISNLNLYLSILLLNYSNLSILLYGKYLFHQYLYTNLVFQ